jgi:DNA-binding SARP family transcriptional activator/tetratricopeptide (TPR) repeat protein/DNA-binding XRE family transcriptional regulator/DNA polymerase III delta prime subunit
VGAQLRQWRRTAGLSQRQLAEQAGISLGSVRDLEQGRVKHPHQATIMRLVETLRLDGDESAGFIRECRARRSWPDARPGSGLKIHVLGALAGWRSGVAFAPGPPRPRAVLGLLALHPGQALHRDVIIDALWGDHPPASAVDLLHTHVSRLRHLLEPGRPARDHDGLHLHCDGGSYRLELTGDELDLLAFRELARRGREAALACDDAAACTIYSEALGLWHGEPLCDVQVLRGHPAVASVASEHEEAVLGYAAAAVSAGRPERVRPYLRALADREPLNEPVHAMLMQTLASGGDQAAALAVYDRMRRGLDDELGVRPGAVLAEAHSRVLHQQIPVAAARTDPMSMYQLPSRIPDFTGRARERAVLAAALLSSTQAVPVALVLGPPGVGKTTLAVHVAHSLRSSFPDGQLWVQLAGASPSPRDPGEVLSELLRVLGVHGPAIPDGMAERAALLRSRLADKKVLLAADDAASAAQVLPLLPGTASCAVIVTSRRRLAGLAGAAFVELEPFNREEAVSLLDRIAGSGRVAAEPGAAADLVAACGLLPLAVRIAGSKLAVRPSWPVSVLTARVTEERRRLDELEAENLSVRASIATSYQSLPGQVGWAFRLLGLLGPGDVAEWVIAALLGIPDASQVVAELTDRCLLTPIGVDRTGQPRYRMHDLIRDFAAERAAGDSATDRRAALRRAVGAWLQFAAMAAGRLPPEPFFPAPPPGQPQPIVPDSLARQLTADPVAWFTAEHPNLPAAIRLACDAGWYELAAELAGRCASFWELRWRYDTVERSWAVIAHAARQADDGLAECEARLRQAAALCVGGRSADALELLNSCIPEFDRSGKPESLALGLYWRSYCYDDIDELDRALDDAARGVLLARRAGSWLGEFMNLRGLGEVLVRRGERSKGLEYCEQALSFADKCAAPYYQVAARYSLAYACIHVGQYEKALRMARSVADLAATIGSARLEVSALGIMGDAYQGLALYEQAAAVLLRALPRFRNHSRRRHYALCLLKLGYAYQAMSRYDEASRYLEQSLPIFRELRLPRYIERVLACLDECHPQPPATEASSWEPAAPNRNRYGHNGLQA